MTHVIRITPKANADIDAAVAWRSRRSIPAAVRWHGGLLTTVRTLRTNPERCPAADEAADVGIDLRMLRYGRRRDIYRILFVIEGQTVQVLRIRHAAQDRLTADDL